MPVSFSGDWNAAQKQRERIERNKRAFSKSISKYAAEEYVDTVKEMIATQDSGETKWVISSAWILKKSRMDASNENKAWINSGEFASKIRSKPISDGVYFGGALTEDSYGGGDLNMAQVAAFNEYGTKYTDPRPLFGPARVKTMKKIQPALVERTKKMLSQNAYTE